MAAISGNNSFWGLGTPPQWEQQWNIGTNEYLGSYTSSTNSYARDVVNLFYKRHKVKLMINDMTFGDYTEFFMYPSKGLGEPPKTVKIPKTVLSANSTKFVVDMLERHFDMNKIEKSNPEKKPTESWADKWAEENGLGAV